MKKYNIEIKFYNLIHKISFEFKREEMTSINHNSKFCEGSFKHSLDGNVATEYVNAFSSLAMTFYGLVGLFYLKCRQPHMIYFMYSNLAFCGIGSFIYHLTFYWFAALLDGFPMIMMTSLGMLLILWDFTFDKFNKVRIGSATSSPLIKRNVEMSNSSYSTETNSSMGYYDNTTTQDVESGNVKDMSKPYIPTLPIPINRDISNNTKQILSARITALLCFIITCYLQLTLMVSGTAINYTAYVVLFAFPLLPINAFMIYYHFKKDGIPGTIEQIKKVKVVCKYAWIIGVIAFVFWILDQVLCKSWPPIVYFYGHGIWHIGIGYFAMSLICFASYMLADNFNSKPEIIYFLKIFPLTNLVEL
jgi:hypothetical protein